MEIIEAKSKTDAELIREQFASLTDQLDAVEDAIGAEAVSWRAAAADPAAMQRAAERLSTLECQRDLLRKAKEDAQFALDQIETVGRAERAEADASVIRERVHTALDAREALGRELAATVERVAQLVEALHKSGQEVLAMFTGDTYRLSGVSVADIAMSVNAQDMSHDVNQVLGWRLGKTLWPVERSDASRRIRIDERIKGECEPVRHMFDRGVAAHVEQIVNPVR